MADPIPNPVTPPKKVTAPDVKVGRRTSRPAIVGGEKVTPTPVTIVGTTGGRSVGVTRLGTPVAFLMLLGLLLVYYALHGWDRKYGTFGGTFAGKALAGTGGGTGSRSIGGVITKGATGATPIGPNPDRPTPPSSSTGQAG